MEYSSGTVSPCDVTPTTTGLFLALSADLDRLQQMLIRSSTQVGVPEARGKHLDVVETLRQLFIRNDPVYSLFSAYPTHRVMRLLLEATSEAKSAARWLTSNPLVGIATKDQNDDYARLCQKLQGTVREWYVFVKAHYLASNLDEVPPETLH